MRRTLNVKFLVAFVLGFIFLGVGVHFLHARQAKRNAKALLELSERKERNAKALLEFAQRKQQDAEEPMKAIPSLTPRDSVRLAMFGFMIGSSSDPEPITKLTMLQILARAVEQAARMQAGVDMVAAAKYLGQYLTYMPRDVDAHVKYAQILEQLVDASGFVPENPYFVQAYRAFDRILRLDPDRSDRLEIHGKLVDWAMMAKRYADAETHLQALLNEPLEADRKRKAKLEFLLGQCCEGTGKFERSVTVHEGAKEHYEKAIKAEPQQIESYVALANLYQRRLNNPPEAVKELDQLIENNDRSFQAYMARAIYWKESNQPDRAAKEIDKAYALAPDDAGLAKAGPKLAADVQQLFLLFADLARDRAKARKALIRGLRLHPENAAMYQLHAAMYQLLAGLESADNKPKEAEVWLRQGLHDMPSRPELLWAAANLAIDQGKDDKDQDLVQDLAQLEKIGVSRARMDYLEARKLMNKERWSDAIAILEKNRPKLIKSPELLKQIDLALGRCHSEAGEPQKAYAAYRRASEIDLLDADACLGMGSALVALGRTDEALETYRRIISQSPQARLETARLLIQKNLGLDKDQRQWSKIDQYLSDPDTAKVCPMEMTLLRTEVLLAQDQPKAAKELLEKALATQPQVVELWIALADAVDQQEGAAEVEAVLDRAKKACGDRVELRLARARWASRDAAAASSALAKLEKDQDRFSSSDRLRLLDGLAWSYERLGKIEDAKRLWNQLTKERPNDIRTRMILFDIALDQGDQVTRDRLLEEIKSAGDSAVALAEALSEEAKQRSQKGKDYGQAIDKLRRAIEQGERDPAVARRLAQLAYLDTETKASRLIDNRPDEAVAVIRAYVRGTAQPKQILLLVSFLGRHGRASDALDLCQQAWRKCAAEEVAEACLLLLQNDPTAQKAANLDRVELWLTEAIAKHKQSSRLALCLAALRDLQARYDDAEKIYRDLIAKEPDNPIVLNNLAWLLALRGRADEALKLMGRAIEITGPLPSLLDTQAVAYLSKGDAASAIEVLKKAMQAADAQPAFGFHLARAQLMRQDRPAAAAAWEQALKSGLRRDQLHTLERDAYEQLRGEFKQKSVP